MSCLEQYQRDFIHFLVEEKILVFGDFVTKSGRKTPYFLNMGLCSSGYRIDFLGNIFSKHIHFLVENNELEKDITALYGPAYKGITLVSSIAQKLHENFQWNLDFFYNRKEVKKTGEKGVLVGNRPLTSDDKILLVDDVVTVGTSIYETREIIKNHGDSEIKAMMICVDRMEKIGDNSKSVVDTCREEGFNIYPIVNIQELIESCRKNNYIDEEMFKKAQDYWGIYL